jgi:hypothetical protein
MEGGARAMHVEQRILPTCIIGREELYSLSEEQSVRLSAVDFSCIALVPDGPFLKSSYSPPPLLPSLLAFFAYLSTLCVYVCVVYVQHSQIGRTRV